MDFKQKITRLKWLPYGFIKGLLDMANTKARDLENSSRFPNVIIEKNCTFSSDVTIGNNSRICNHTTINHSSIGICSYINFNSLIQHTEIGNYCSIAHGVKMGLGAHPINLISTSPIFYKVKNSLNLSLVDKDIEFKEYNRIKIGSDVWIGADAIIMDGVNIGNGAIIAAGAIVTRDVPDYGIVGGIPAKLIKYRFNKKQREALLITKWWKNEPNIVKEHKKRLNEIIEDK